MTNKIDYHKINQIIDEEFSEEAAEIWEELIVETEKNMRTGQNNTDALDRAEEFLERRSSRWWEEVEKQVTAQNFLDRNRLPEVFDYLTNSTKYTEERDLT